MNIDTPEKIRMCMVHDDNRRYVKMVYRDITVKQRIGLEVFKMPKDRMEHTIMGLAKQAKVQMVRECVKRHYPVPTDMEIYDDEQAVDAVSSGNGGNGDKAEGEREGDNLAQAGDSIDTPFSC